MKIPSGNCPLDPTPVMTGVGGMRVTVAVADPLGPVAVTASVPVEDMAAGACVAPRFKETVTGEMIRGFKTCSVTAADADPPGPTVVTV